jgi:hypothetical protein
MPDKRRSPSGQQQFNTYKMELHLPYCVHPEISEKNMVIVKTGVELSKMMGYNGDTKEAGGKSLWER